MINYLIGFFVLMAILTGVVAIGIVLTNDNNFWLARVVL